MIAVSCVWVRGNVPYSVDYVARLRSMVSRHLKVPHRFMCLTDRPNELPSGVIPVVIRGPVLIPGWWSKLELFNPAFRSAFGLRNLYLDLDSIIVSDLAPVVMHTGPGDLSIVPDGGTFQGRGHLRVVKRYNSSVMVWTPTPVLWSLWQDFNLGVTNRLWGDQDWIGEQYQDANLMPAEWFPRVSELGGNPPGPEAKVVLCKKPKNVEAAEQLPWVREAWQ